MARKKGNVDELAEWLRILASTGEYPPEFRRANPLELVAGKEATKRLPPPFVTVDNKLTLLCACGKAKRVTEMPLRDSGVVKFTDNICAGCKLDVKGLATLVCGRCRRAVGRIKPQRDARTGFVLEANKCYHLDGCPSCKPVEGREIACTTPLIEKILHDRKIKR